MCVFAAALVTVLLTGVWTQADWMDGRATFYGNEWWLWNIHEGSCGYGYLCPEEGTGWDVAALPDVHWGYAGSCGRCYEVACNPTKFQDGYGETLDRSYMCYDPSASVVVTITDTCPCNYATNFFSNKRWCCGDMDHLDISIWTFEKLAPAQFGVIGLKYREVPCDHKPYNPAPEIAAPFPPTPIPEGTVCPKGRFPLKDNWQQVQAEFRMKAALAGAGAYANTPALDISESINEVNSISEAATIGQEDTVVETNVVRDGLQDGWQTVSFQGESQVVEGAGMSGGRALCTKLEAGGVTTVSGSPGFSSQMSSMEFWIQQQNSNTLALDFNLAGLSGVQCQAVHVTDLASGEAVNGFTKYNADLSQFGCAVDASQLDSLVLQNTQPYEQHVCVDEVKFLG